jgi:FkbM family methyltransferase
MKELIRRFIRHLGFEVLHHSSDPILAELRDLHECLRLDMGATVRWDDVLPQPAAHASLCHLLQLHRIDLLLDVGANNGQFARLARRLGYTGEIVSFEPQSCHHRELLASAGVDGNWRVMTMALGDEEAELELHVYEDDSFSSLHRVNAAGVSRFDTLVRENRVERVRVSTLDSLWQEIAGTTARRVMLKTDTQGHDLCVLEGASDALRSTYAVVTEAALLPIYAGAPLYGEVAAWLAERGFVPSGLFPISHRQVDSALIEMDAYFTKSEGA